MTNAPPFIRLCSLLLIGAALSLMVGCGGDDAAGQADGSGGATSGSTGNDSTGNGTTGSSTGSGAASPGNPDFNGDGAVKILFVGSTESLQQGGAAFAIDRTASELRSIIETSPAAPESLEIDTMDVRASKALTTGYGQGGKEYDWNYEAHSLAQFYFWPEGRQSRLQSLEGLSEHDYDHVFIAGDPHIVATMPGYYALGVDKIASQVAQGDAQPHLLMMWPPATSNSSIEHFEEFSHRIAMGSSVSLPVVPAGRAWATLPSAKQDMNSVHPTPNGSYLAAAAIYAHLYGQSASESQHSYDDEIADVAAGVVNEEANKSRDMAPRSFVSPFLAAGIADRVLRYNHTGSSSENGILKGLKWVLGQAKVKLQSGGEAPIHFNYGRANTEFEPGKRYKIDPTKFDFSLGFPMQDHSNHGDTTMLYGLDKRRSDTENGTDLGVARKMIRDAELPHARTIPIRTLFAQLKDAWPEQSAYSDGWHMHGNLDKAVGAYMYTLLTGHCALGVEPEEKGSKDWLAWMAHKIGYETAWTLMHMRAVAPGLKVIAESENSTSMTTSKPANVAVAFANRPDADVTVVLSSDKPGAVIFQPAKLTFTPENHDQPQTVSMLAEGTSSSEQSVVITLSSNSADAHFDGVTDRWRYDINP